MTAPAPAIVDPLERARDGWAKALQDHPFVCVDDLIAEIRDGRAQHWGESRSDVFTRVYGNGVLELGPVSGSLVEMLSVTLPKIETWARHARHPMITELYAQCGREGWERPLKERGWEVAAIIMRKRL